jgi:5-methylcytosine-specific restriction endonuclease McrA
MIDNISTSDTTPLPFDSYPGKGRKLLGPVSRGNCRHEYGLQLQRLTGQTHCAYCGISLVDTFEHWLNMAVDHVIPTSTCNAMAIREEWRDDYSNRVLCCTACNTFVNRYKPPVAKRPSNLEEFFDLRDDIFEDRKKRILERREQEERFYQTAPWTRR